jgi:transcriptional regulator of met regulon
MEKVEYKKIKNSLILLCLQEIITKKRALRALKKIRRTTSSLSIMI